MMITAGIVEAFLKCPTKCYLRSLGAVGTEKAYANWARAQNESYRNDGIKRLTEGTAPDECIIGSPGTTNMKAPKWRLAMDYVVRAQNQGTPVYLDVEGLPDRDFYYLIGLRVKTARGFEQHSLWADTVDQERRIWADFLGVLAGIDNPVLSLRPLRIDLFETNV